MKKAQSKHFDFFTAYRREQFRKMGSYLLSGAFALLLAFSFVSSQEGNVSGLMASVANLTSSPVYDADLILQRSENELVVVFGSNAEKVNSVSFTVLSDPSRFRGIHSSDAQVTISSLGEGMYRVTKTLEKVNILPGSVIAELEVNADDGISMSIIDTEFTSEGISYQLTSKVE